MVVVQQWFVCLVFTPRRLPEGKRDPREPQKLQVCGERGDETGGVQLI